MKPPCHVCLVFILYLSSTTTAVSQFVLTNELTGSFRDVKSFMSLVEGESRYPVLDCLDTLKITRGYSFELIVKNEFSIPVKYYFLYGVGYEHPCSVFIDGVAVPGQELAYYLPLELEPHTKKSVLFSMQELDRMNNEKFSPKLLTEKDFDTYEEYARKVAQPFFLGIFFFMTFFNSFFFVISRWMVYLKYALYILVSSVFFIYYFGFSEAFNPVLRLPYNLVWILSSLITVFYILFVRDFGDFKNVNPRADKALVRGMYFKLIQTPFEVVMYLFHVEIIHTPAYRMVILGSEILIAIYIFTNVLLTGTARGKIIIIASFMLLLGSIAGQLNMLALLDKAVLIEAGMFVELLIFSVALAYITKDHETRHREVTESLLRQSREMERMQNAVSKELERQVSERTYLIEKKSEENELLLNEIHHRVKNNLQIMSSLVNLQSRKSKSAKVSFFLQELSNKILSMGLVHERLYRKTGIEVVDVTDYLRDLGHKIISSLSMPNYKVQVDFHFHDTKTVPLENAIILGLIHNELITNSIKYARNEIEGVLKIQCGFREENGTLFYYIKDNGPGIVSVAGKSRFELRFVEQLAKKINGRTTYASDNGLLVEIGFPAP